jgi:Trypsin-like peptidase domain
MRLDVDDLRREVEVYAAWPDEGLGTSGWRCGSGYLLGGRLILTAAHVVSLDAERVLTTVRVRVGTELVTAEVAWHRPPDDADVALLVVTEPEWAVPRWRQPVRFGRLVTNRTGQQCKATGFPAVVAEPRRRDSHVATGTLNPGSLVKAGLYAMEVTNAPAPPGATGSRWAGMSGAALLCAVAGRQEMVIGVITADPAGFDSRRLTAVPITSIANDDGFQKLIEEHCGRAPVVEAVEFAGLCERAPAPESPAGLLRADAEITPFRPRPELDRLYE